jgi:hypothetical protein
VSRYWFTPAPGYDGLPIELTAGWHDRNGKFHPKHVKRSPGISRLSRKPRARIPMVGYPRNNEWAIYEMMMAEKRGGKP